MTASQSQLRAPYVTEETFRRLTEGSLEGQLQLLRKGLERELPGSVLIASFDEHVLCVFEGSYYRVGYRLVEGIPRFTDGEEIEAPSVLSPMLWRPRSSREQLALRIESLELNTPWLRLYDRKRLTIRRYIGDNLSEAKGRPLPSYSFLYETDSTVDEARYKKSVASSLREIGQRIDALGQTVRESFERLPKGAFSEGGILEASFGTFAEDLSADLETHGRAAQKLSEQCRDIRGLARYYDALAKRYQLFEEAVCFVRLVTTRLDPEIGD